MRRVAAEPVVVPSSSRVVGYPASIQALIPPFITIARAPARPRASMTTASDPLASTAPSAVTKTSFRDKSHPARAKRSSTRASRVDASASIPSISTRTIFDPGTRGPMVPSPSVAPTRASIATCIRCVVTFSSTASASISLVKLEHHDADDADVEDGSLDSANPFSRGSIAPVAPCRSRARVTRREPIAFILNHLHRRVACMHPSVRRHHHR